MTVVNEADAYRKSSLGAGPVSKASGTLSATTFNLFTVTGDVLITSFYLKCTTAISTDGGTLAVRHDPTTGDQMTLVSATDLGTTDTAVGTVVGLTRGTSAVPAFLRAGTAQAGFLVQTGVTKLVGASSVNGAVTAYCTWIPLSSGATLVAA